MRGILSQAVPEVLLHDRKAALALATGRMQQSPFGPEIRVRETPMHAEHNCAGTCPRNTADAPLSSPYWGGPRPLHEIKYSPQKYCPDSRQYNHDMQVIHVDQRFNLIKMQDAENPTPYHRKQSCPVIAAEQRLSQSTRELLCTPAWASHPPALLRSHRPA